VTEIERHKQAIIFQCCIRKKALMQVIVAVIVLLSISRHLQNEILGLPTRVRQHRRRRERQRRRR